MKSSVSIKEGTLQCKPVGYGTYEIKLIENDYNELKGKTHAASMVDEVFNADEEPEQYAIDFLLEVVGYEE